MDKIMIDAVAGSGKTQYIIDKLNVEKRTVIITYTTANQEVLKSRIFKRFGYKPNNITVYGLFQFLFSFCLRPILRPRLRGMIFDRPQYHEKDINGDWIYKDRLSRYILRYHKEDIKFRIEKYIDEIFVDEIQDLTSDDFDFLLFLGELSIPVYAVGDFYQRTFKSSIRGNKNKNITVNYDIYINELKSNGYSINTEELNISHRCSEDVCTFVRENLGIEIYSEEGKNSKVKFIDNLKDILAILEDNKIVKLFYQKHYNFKCESNNWGNSKGETYKDVCIILNKKTYKKYIQKDLSNLAPTTKSKFYVACTRTKNNLYFISQDMIPKEFVIGS